MFHRPVDEWFSSTLGNPTAAQSLGWASIAKGQSTLLLAPTGSGKTLAAFLIALDRLLFDTTEERQHSTRVLYISPLKALAVDVERNLHVPINGIRETAERLQTPIRLPTIGLRSGDTPSGERAKLRRRPPDILITTPESLFLMLTSGARETLRDVETVIIDEIHAIAATKRGTHLSISLERLERLRSQSDAPLQRIGLSATQRPLEEIARLLGGGLVSADGRWNPRPVEIVDAGSRKEIALSIEVPVEDMSRLGEIETENEDSSKKSRVSIWPSIHPRLIELIRGHRSTMIFVNNRRLAERLASALNEEAEEEIALAHHGSIARETRLGIEGRLKRGDLPAIVATASMELGVDMGAVDLVVQIESPPSIASGLQRIGRANHSVGATPEGAVFPKHRGDLLACAAVAKNMVEGKVESTRYPRNPLDVLAQQIVATCSMDAIHVDELFDLMRQAAPFAELPRSSFEGVLDMLSGRYPDDDFRDLKPRLTWDRTGGGIRAREGAKLVAVTNAGTIPDSGLYGVFLSSSGDSGTSRRVGELDEEMVFETQTGDVFLLGASSWRVEEVTHDRVLVQPAPGEPGTMPFWRGDGPSRALEFGMAIGALTRELQEEGRLKAEKTLKREYNLDDKAARNLIDYLDDQSASTGSIPNDRCIVIESFVDEVGDWRVCILTPFGRAIHDPWANAIAAKLEERSALTVEAMSSDDGITLRLPEVDEPPGVDFLIPSADEVEELVIGRLSSTALFAARFRENAARALLLPRRRPGKRQPLWVQRKRAANLLQVAARFRSFPIILETYRECLQDVFDLPGLIELLKAVANREIRIVEVETRKPSPFAASLLFAYAGNFVYDADTPFAERRARSLAIDHTQLKELLGESELRQLLDPDAIDEIESTLQRLSPERWAKHADGIHDLLLELGALEREEIACRTNKDVSLDEALNSLEAEHRLLRVRIANEDWWIAAEDAARYRDGLAIPLPAGLAAELLEPVDDPMGDLVSRYAKTHGPFPTSQLAARWGIPRENVEKALISLESAGRLAAGSFLRDGGETEWCDIEVLRSIKRRSLARLRAEIEPVESSVLAKLFVDWQGVEHPGRGIDAVLEAIETLQGAPIIASELESIVLPARVRDYRPEYLDELFVTGTIVWRGLEPLGARDGRIALYLREQYSLLAPNTTDPSQPVAQSILETLQGHHMFFADILQQTDLFRGDVLDALWALVWSGHVTNDSLAPLRSLLSSGDPREKRRSRQGSRFAQRAGPAGSEGRWSMLPPPSIETTARAVALAQNLLNRYGVLVREAVRTEGIEGGFSAVYPILKVMEEQGRTRRGYFVGGLGATQFASGGADDRLRSLRDAERPKRARVLSACDPANPYGAVLPWPTTAHERLERRAGAKVFLLGGELLAYLTRSERQLECFIDSAKQTEKLQALSECICDWIHAEGRRAFLIEQINGERPDKSPLAKNLREAGFRPGPAGWQYLSPRRDPSDGRAARRRLLDD